MLGKIPKFLISLTKKQRIFGFSKFYPGILPMSSSNSINIIYFLHVFISNNKICSSGPDICGPGTKKVHVIFNYQGKNHLIKKDIRCKDDVYTHLYTLIVNPDNTYEVRRPFLSDRFIKRNDLYIFNLYK